MSAAPRLPYAFLFALLGVVVTLPSCVVGPSADGLAPAQTGRGVDIVVTPLETPEGPTYGHIRAELLAVRDDALLLQMGLITLVPYASIVRAEVEGLERLSFGDGQPPTDAKRQELRLLSRYPQGVSDDLLRRLLDAYDQDELHTIP
jgi:hypothetical protein